MIRRIRGVGREELRAVMEDAGERKPERPPASPRGVTGALAHTAFALVWSGALVSNVGNFIENVCQAWLVWDGSHSTVLSGILQFAVSLPGVFLALPMGLVADRFDRRRLLLLLQIVLTILAAVQAFAAHLKWVQPWTVIAIALFEGTAAAAMVPVWSSLLPDLVPREDMGGAIALSSFQFNVARVIGPWLGAQLALFSFAFAFDVNVASFALVIFALAIVRSREHAPAPQAWRTELREAYALAREHRGLFRLLWTGALFLSIAAPLISLMPALASTQLDGDVKTYSWLLSAMGMGAAAGALLMGVLARLLPRRKIIALGSAFVGTTLLAAGFSRSIWLTIPVIFAFGIGWCVTLTMQSTALQILVPDRMRGRIMSFNYFAMMAPATFAHPLAGLAARHWSLAGTLGGLGCALFALAAVNLVFSEPAIDGSPIGVELGAQVAEPRPELAPVPLPIVSRRVSVEAAGKS
jgi:MFS family permease